MRNKLLALILALTMIVGLATMAPLAASAEGVETIGSDVVSEAAELLMTLNILQGYSDGTLGLGYNITRAEFTAMLARMLQGTDELNLNAGAIVHSRLSETPENIAAVKAAAEKAPGASVATVGKGYYQTDISSTDLADPAFSDVDASHWAYSDIEYLRGQGIVTGYSDGSFKPDNNILYEEAVKFVVSALGYDFMAVTYGGYPGGYMQTANSLKILKNVGGTNGVAVTRQEVAVLLYNALTVDYLVVESTKGDTNVYAKGKNILNYVFGLDIMEDCYVTATTKTGTDSVNHRTEEGIIEVGVTRDGGYEFKYFNDLYEDYLGYKVKAYVKFDEDDHTKGELYCMFPYGKTKKVTINSQDIKDSDIENGLFEAFVNDEAEEFKIAEEPIVIYNGVALDVDDIDKYVDGERGIEAGDVTLISTDGDKTYELIYINSYIPIYVENVKVEDKEITGTAYFGGEAHEDYKLSLDEEDEENEIKVEYVRADGTEGFFEEISTDSVIYVRQWKSNYIVNFTNETVTGITTRRGNGYVIIDGIKYEEIDESGALDDFKAGTNLTLGLDFNGEVFFAKANIGVSGLSYGLLMDINYEVAGSFEPKFEVKMMDASGKIGFYNVADGMKFTYNKVTKRYNADGANYIDFETIKANLFESAKKASMQETSQSHNSASRPYEQLIKYSLNSYGEINEIVTAIASSSVAPEERAAYFTYEDYDLAKAPFHWGDGFIKGTPYEVNGVKLFYVAKYENPEDSEYKAGTWGTGARSFSNGVRLFDVALDGKVGAAITGFDYTDENSNGKNNGALYMVEYFSSDVATVKIEGEIEDAYEIGLINVEKGIYESYNSVGTYKGKYEYGYLDEKDSYEIGDVIVPRTWSKQVLFKGYNTVADGIAYVVDGNNPIGQGDSAEEMVRWGYFPIRSMITRIIAAEQEGNNDVCLRIKGDEGNYSIPQETVFGKVKEVTNGKVIVSYGDDAYEAVSCVITGKKAARYDCETGYVALVNAESVEVGDWVILQMAKREYVTMMIYTNVEEASLDNIKSGADAVENERD